MSEACGGVLFHGYYLLSSQPAIDAPMFCVFGISVPFEAQLPWCLRRYQLAADPSLAPRLPAHPFPFFSCCRFAVRHGMAGFVKGMVPAVEAFVAERRQRVQPFAEDPSSFGRRLLTSSPAPPQLPTTPLTADKAAGAAANGPCYASELSTAGSESGYSFEDSASERSRGGACPLSRPSSMRRLGAMMFASGEGCCCCWTIEQLCMCVPAFC